MSDGRYDVLVTCEDLDVRLSPGTCAALFRYLAVNRVVYPVEESLAETWSEVYSEPGASAHVIFMKGVYDSKEPVFLEAVARFGTKSVAMPFGADDQQINFYLEFRGCRYKEPLGPFKKRFNDMIRQRPKVFWREHTELAPHREVPDDEKPQEKKKGGDIGGKAGTSVEEW